MYSQSLIIVRLFLVSRDFCCINVVKLLIIHDNVSIYGLGKYTKHTSLKKYGLDALIGTIEVELL